MKLSIITINYNNVSGLRKTMESVFAQTCKDFEYIVVDGASTDGSVDVIHEFDSLNTQRSTLNVFTWVSEKDTGIYNAMNKGVRMANGEYVLMLNSGDYFVDDHVVERILPELDGTDIVQGNIVIEEDGKEIVKRGYGRSDISFVDAIDAQFLHQASFIKRSLHDRYGLYDESYKKNSDTYFFRKVLGFGNATFRYVDVLVTNFDTTGISNDPKWLDVDREENTRWMKENISGRLQQFYFDSPAKIKLYDKIHRHKWAWLIMMAFIRLINIIERLK